MNDYNKREVHVYLDGSEMCVLFDQGEMSEDELWDAAVNYVLSNISVEVI